MLLFLLTLAADFNGRLGITAIISGIGDAGKVAQSHTVLNKKGLIHICPLFFPECNVTRSYRLPPQGLN